MQYLVHMDSDLLTIREAAAYLGVSAATLRNWDRKGRIATRRHPFNNYRVYALQDLRTLKAQLDLFTADPSTGDGAPPPRDPAAPRSLRRLLTELHRVLRDTDGDSSIIERFDEITKLVYLKVVDERATRNATQSPFTVGLAPKDRARLARESYARCVQALPAYFPQRFASLRMTDAAIGALAERLAPHRLSGDASDMAGTAYEDMVADTFDKQDNQQFFTPHPVVNFMAGLIDVGTHPRVICDPACGTGGFLVAAGKRFSNSSPTPRLLGLEIDERLAWATRLNLDIHGLTHFCVETLDGSGSLAADAAARFGGVDWILTNPPFGSDLADPVALAALELGRGRGSRRRGALFIERCLDLLAPGGHVAIVIDDGVLNAPSNEDVRQLILARASVIAVFSLPEVAFMPYATVKSSILLLQRSQGHRGAGRDTFFCHVDAVGRRPNGDLEHRVNQTTGALELDSDLPACLQAFDAWRTSQKMPEAGQRAFTGRIPGLKDSDFVAAGMRLDLPYHDPARTESLTALKRARHPLSRLGDLCELRREAAVPAQDFPDEEFVYVGLANIEAHTGTCQPAIVRGSSVKSPVLRARAGDVLFAKMRPELRKVWRLPSQHPDVFASPECLVLRVREDRILPDLLVILLRSDLVFGQLVHQVTGIGRPRISMGSMLDLAIPVPPLKHQERILTEYRKQQASYEKLVRDGRELLERSKLVRGAAVSQVVSSVVSGQAAHA